jgi:aldehyde:ferredoxin oxidoreductase
MHAGSSAGLCFFCMITGGIPVYESLSAVTGWDIARQDFAVTGHRILTLRQCYNVREGIEPGSVRVPDRILGNPPLEKGPLAGVTVDLETLRREFYSALGWDDRTGVPTEECLQSLGIERR